MTNIPLDKLKRAVELREQIEVLENELKEILGAAPAASAPPATPKKRTMSAAARAKISATQRARAAARKAMAKPSARAKQSKGMMSPAVKAKIAAAMQARWARIRAEKQA